MRCEEAKERLVEFIEEELGSSDRAAIETHLAECDACASELAALQRTMSLLEDDGYVEPSPFYWTRFEAELKRKLRGRSERFVLVPRFENLTPRLAPVAVAVLLFCVGLGVGLGPILNMASAPETSEGTFAERSPYDGGPVISPRTKSLVEGALEREAAEFATYSADTLQPESFDSAIEEPRMILATEEFQSDVERSLGENLLGN